MVSTPATDDIDTADIRAFCRVVDLGSITAAAASLGETKGSISRRVSRLERALGAPLIHRHARRVEGTEDGLLYRQKAGEALNLLEDAAATLRDQRGTPSGHLRVTAPLGIGTFFLGPLVAPFVEAWPGITLELVLTDAVLSFDRDRIDVALRLSAALPDSSLVARRLFEPVGALVASPEYLARHSAPQHPDDLEHHRLLLPPLRGIATPMAFEPADGGRPVHLSLRGRVLSHDLLLLREATLAGAGIMMLPFLMADRDVAAGRLVPVLPGWRLASMVSLWLLTPGGPLSPKVRVFRDFIREAAAAGVPRWSGREAAHRTAPGEG